MTWKARSRIRVDGRGATLKKVCSALRKRAMYLSVLRLLHRHAAPGSSLLDVGCSCGGFLEEARREGYQASGMDIVPEMVEYCRKRGFPCHVGASLAGIDVADSSLDIVSVLDCNYYWPDQIAELRHWTKTVPQRPVGDARRQQIVDVDRRACSAPHRARFGNKICVRAVNDHRVSIPVRSLLRILRREGFDILYASPAGALHGGESSFAVKANFAVGYLLWLVSRRYLVPGCLILARKQSS